MHTSFHPTFSRYLLILVCPPEVVERHQPCDPATGIRPVIRHLHNRIGCKCVSQTKTDVEPCGKLVRSVHGMPTN